MEPKEEYKTVYYGSTPISNAEAQMDANYIVQDNEDQVLVFDDDGSIVIDENTTFVDEDGNPIIINRANIRVINDKSVVKIEKSGSPVTMEENDDCSIVVDENTTFIDEDGNPVVINRANTRLENEGPVVVKIERSESPVAVEEKSSEHQDESLMTPDHSNKQCESVDEGNTSMEHDESLIEEASPLKGDQPSTYKPVVSFLKRKHRSDSEGSEEDPASCKNIVVYGTDEEPCMESAVEEQNLPQCPEGVVIDKYTCRYCFKKFSRTCNKLRHMRIVHKVQKNSHSFIRCIECNTIYKKVQYLRDHLQSKHKMRMEQQELKFPNMNAFKKWKHEVERKELILFTMRHGRKKTQGGGHKYFYACHRAGKYEERSTKVRKRMFRAAGTCKLGIMCTASMSCEECPDGVNVVYCAHHYGHGKETTFVQLTEMEQNAIQENISNGVSYANLLGDMREGGASDQFQVGLIKKKDIKMIKNAFLTEEYNPGLSDAESVDRWVRICCQMEDSPVLFYRQEDSGGREEQFMLIMMTEFQRHILLSSDNAILGLDNVHRRKGGRFYLTCLVALDECNVAFPVAFCISNKVDKSVIKQFLMAVKDSTGPLSCKFFMTDSESYYHEAWVEVMQDDSKWLWSMWYVDNRIRVQLRPMKGMVAKRAQCYRTMRRLLECNNLTVFETMFKNYVQELLSDPVSRNLGNFIQQKYGSNKELWAYCYHKDIQLSSIIQFEVLHRTLRFCCREGRKQRLDKFIFVIMKLVRFKMLDRLTSLLDDEKISLAIDAINMCHSLGLDIPTERISSIADKIWLVRSEDDEENEYVVREFDACPDHCPLKCNECDICVHMYSCSCMHSMINANLCQHIHAVVWKFLTPHFSPMPSPARGDDYDVDDDVTDLPSQPRGLFDDVLKRTHDVYKKVRSNKCAMSEDSLNAVMKKLDECMDICSGKVVVDPKPEPSGNNSMFILNTLGKNSSGPTAMMVPQNITTMLPQNITGMLSQNFTGKLPQNIATMLPQNIAGMLPQNFSGKLPQNIATMLPQNITGMLPQNVTGILPQNFAGKLPQNFAGKLPQTCPQFVLFLPNALNNGACAKK